MSDPSLPDARRRLAVALDFASREEIVACARELAPEVGTLKVGLEAFVGHGPDLVRELVGLGAGVFLDLKLHDIPNTVAGAAAAAGRLGASILTVHAAGGRDMMAAALEAARNAAAASGHPAPRVVAVTVLTSLDAPALASVGLAGTPHEAALRLAGLARDAGLDGVVSSPEEVGAIRAALGDGLLLVVPGIRPAGSEAGDQKRVATPADAVRAGASLLVVGRPITRAADRVAASRALVRQIAEATP